MIQNKYNIGFIGLLLFHALVLLFLINDFSISYKEALTYFDGSINALSIITNISCTILGRMILH